MLTGAYRFPPMDSVIYGRPFAEALKEQVEESGANSVFLLASGTLNRETDLVGEVRRALGNRLAGVHARIGAHTPRNDVVEAANAARTAGADLLATLGGGSVTDAANSSSNCTAYFLSMGEYNGSSCSICSQTEPWQRPRRNNRTSEGERRALAQVRWQSKVLVRRRR